MLPFSWVLQDGDVIATIPDGDQLVLMIRNKLEQIAFAVVEIF